MFLPVLKLPFFYLSAGSRFDALPSSAESLLIEKHTKHRRHLHIFLSKVKEIIINQTSFFIWNSYNCSRALYSNVADTQLSFLAHYAVKYAMLPLDMYCRKMLPAVIVIHDKKKPLYSALQCARDTRGPEEREGPCLSPAFCGRHFHSSVSIHYFLLVEKISPPVTINHTRIQFALFCRSPTL